MCSKKRKSDKSRRRKTNRRRETTKKGSRLTTRKRSDYKLLEGSIILVEKELSEVPLNIFAEVQSMQATGMI